ncbi:MAG: hypothetical protein HC905_23335 [Bacteroidales bacterium]|nr:hypothetical protein [Bacteroidales bacterium]
MVYNQYVKGENVILEFELDKCCKKNRILKVGSFNPHTCNSSDWSKSFIDAYHPVTSVVEELFKSHSNDFNKIGVEIAN